MGTYLSIPFVSRKVVQLEQVKPVINGVEVSATVTSTATVERIPLTPVHEESKDDTKEEVKEEKVEPKVTPKDDPMIVDFPPVNLKIEIPEEPLPDLSSGSVDRIPEFQGNTDSSHAIKKYNRRHRKHKN
jgi:hypothetical protein